MKLLALLLAAVALTSANHHQRLYRRDINQMVENFKDKLPHTEWKLFWDKLVEALGESKTEFLQKFEENQGNMDQTLQEFADKLAANPAVQQHWENVKSRWATVRETAATTTIKDVLDWIKSKIHDIQPSEYPSFETVNNIWTSMKTYSLSFWNQVANPAPARRYRRETDPVNPREVVKEVQDKFPLAEWNAFWSKLRTQLGDPMTQRFKDKLKENEGKMDLTLSEFGEQLKEHQAINNMWNNIQGKWNEATTKADSTTIGEIINIVKEKVGGLFGDVSPERAQEYAETAKSNLASYWNTILEGVEKYNTPGGQY